MLVLVAVEVDIDEHFSDNFEDLCGPVLLPVKFIVSIIFWVNILWEIEHTIQMLFYYALWPSWKDLKEGVKEDEKVKWTTPFSCFFTCVQLNYIIVIMALFMKLTVALRTVRVSISVIFSKGSITFSILGATAMKYVSDLDETLWKALRAKFHWDVAKFEDRAVWAKGAHNDKFKGCRNIAKSVALWLQKISFVTMIVNVLQIHSLPADRDNCYLYQCFMSDSWRTYVPGWGYLDPNMFGLQIYWIIGTPLKSKLERFADFPCEQFSQTPFQVAISAMWNSPTVTIMVMLGLGIPSIGLDIFHLAWDYYYYHKGPRSQFKPSTKSKYELLHT